MSPQKRFCDLLSEMLKNYEKSQTAFYTELGITKPYFYDILKGRANPPPPEKQFKMVKILKPDAKTREEFFELAAAERCEMPADLMRYITKSARSSLRESDDYTKKIDSIIEGDRENG